MNNSNMDRAISTIKVPNNSRGWTNLKYSMIVVNGIIVGVNYSEPYSFLEITGKDLKMVNWPSSSRILRVNYVKNATKHLKCKQSRMIFVFQHQLSKYDYC